jgi:drug/metabolite transporter (DMT)-like permease
MELPLTVGLSVALGRESLDFVQMLLIAVVFIGIVLAITAHRINIRSQRTVFEKGAILAGVAAVGMALTNFLTGVSSQEISPLMTIWFTHSLLAVVCGAYLFLSGQFGNLVTDFKKHPKPIIAQSILDNVAWTAFAASTTYIPIAIATTISESYVALAVLLGLFVNRERLKMHQLVGVVLAVAGVITLAYFSS